MKSRTLVSLFVVGIAMGCSRAEKQKQPAQQPAEPYGTVEKLDPALDAIVPPHAKVERVSTGFGWTEGPIWVQSGRLLFAAIYHNSIMEWIPGKGVTVFLHPSGYQGRKPYAGPEPGSNGMTLDQQGRLTVAGHARRDVFRLESLDPGAKLTVLVDRYHGKRLNSPNDLVYRSDGSLYFTDPPYGLPTQSDHDPLKQLPFNGVFRLPAASSIPVGARPDNRKLQLLIKDLTRPNGIAFSPDEKYLYVSVSDAKHMVWMRYDVKPDGSVTNGTVFCRASASQGIGSPDGIKVDQDGNLYGAGPGGLWIISPEGKHIGTIKLPEKVANCNWGGADGKTLYITASTSVYRIQLEIPGVRP
ncbi:MAG TPA: SMP-30/gluconolactonase/LRE family protein [Terriglobia bacterium]|nr:SMP-30/gluconolactonase/LRE family protein [Terriglobia bacterium]